MKGKKIQRKNHQPTHQTISVRFMPWLTSMFRETAPGIASKNAGQPHLNSKII
jgi:hypothetical protein